MGELLSPVLVAIGTEVEELIAIKAVSPGMGGGACLVAGARLSCFLHLFLLGLLGRRLVGEPEKLVL